MLTGAGYAAVVGLVVLHRPFIQRVRTVFTGVHLGKARSASVDDVALGSEGKVFRDLACALARFEDLEGRVTAS